MPYKIREPEPEPEPDPGPKIPKKPRMPPDVKQKIKEEKLQAYFEQVKAAKAAGLPLEPFEGEEEEEEDFKGCEDEDLLARNTRSFRCLAQVVMSSSSMLRSVEYNFPPVEDPGLDAALDYIEPQAQKDDVGLEIYLDRSKKLKIVPLRRVINSLETPTLNLKFYGLRHNQMKALMECMKCNQYVEFLILQDNFLTPEMTQMLGKMIEVNNVVNFINLKHCYIGPRGASKLNESLPISQSLLELDLSFNSLGDEGVKSLENIAEMPSLQTLNLSHNELTPDCAESLEIIVNCRNLSNLNLSWNRLGSDECYDVLFNAIASTDHLKVFNLSNNGFCKEIGIFMVFTAYLQRTSKLIELDFSWNRMPAGKFIKELRKGCIVNRSLQIVRVGFNPWTPDEAFPLSQVIALNPTLKILDMENIWFNKKVKRVVLNAQLNHKTFIYGGIYQNWEIKGPDMIELMWKRVRAIFMAPKKPKERQEFANFLLNLSGDPMKRSEFEEAMRKMRYVKLFDDVELADALYAMYTTERRIDVLQMQKDYLRVFPNVLDAPDDKKKKKRRRSKSSKGSSRVSIKRSASGFSSKTSVKKSKSSIKSSKSSLHQSRVSIVSEKDSQGNVIKGHSQGEVGESKTKIGSKLSVTIKDSKMGSLLAIKEEGEEQEGIVEQPEEGGEQNEETGEETDAEPPADEAQAEEPSEQG